MDLETMFNSERDARANHTPPDASETFAVVRRGSRRKRAIRATASGSVAALAVIGLGVGALAIQDLRTVAPADSPEPAASPAQIITRGDAYPQAIAVSDSVWDDVTQGWSLSVYSERPLALATLDGTDATMAPAAPAVVYLMSPDGQPYEVAELDAALAAGARVVSWDEENATARIVWEGGAIGEPGGSGVLNLRSGVVTGLDSERVADGYTLSRFVTANQDGDELWEATKGESSRYLRWTPGDGWANAALNDRLGDAGDGGIWSFASAPLITYFPSDDGNAVPLQKVVPDADNLNSSGSGEPPMRGAIYRLDTDAVTEYDVSLPDAVSGCYVTEDRAGEAWAWGPGGTLSYTCESQLVDLPDAGTVLVNTGYVSSWDDAPGPVSRASRYSGGGVVVESSTVGYGQATPAGTGEYECLC